MVALQRPKKGLEGRIGVALFLLASSRIASAQDRWELALRGEIGIPQGYVQVRENEIQGTRLSLRRDLGIETSESLGLEVVRHLRPGSDLRLSVDALLLYGSTTLPDDVFFNGATLQGDTRLVTRPFFLRVNALYERTLAQFAGGGSLAAGVGFSYVLLEFRLQGALAATTRDAETSEDFLTQELPVPLLTLRIELPIGRALSLTSVVTGGWLPSVNSLRSEGGVVRTSQGHADASIGMRRRLGARFRLDATIHGSYFTQHEVSREDDNDIRLRSVGVGLALGASF
jgi:hypothetical protein